jgi:hypothetical protein
MPTLVVLGKVKVAIYFEDHNPPHFHVLTPDDRASISIATLEILTGSLNKHDYQLVVDWARKNMVFLVSEWTKHNE